MAEKVSLFGIKSKENKAKQKNIDPEIEIRDIFECSCLKKDRYKEVLKERYGILGNDKYTLEAIGKRLGVTRERIRQIELTAMKKIMSPKCKKKHAEKFHRNVIEFINSNGGYATEAKIIKHFSGNDSSGEKKNQILFLLDLNKDIELVKENEFHINVWVTENKLGLHAKEVIQKAHEFIKSKGAITDEEEVLKNLRSEAAADILILNMLESAKIVAKVRDEDRWGLSHWREVTPKSIKDKIYLSLKRIGDPKHFEEIAILVNADQEKRKVTKQAVHNELIKDERFVLIGRGIYALSEWGFKRGIVEDVIAEVLKNSKLPLHKNDIISEVMKQRKVKKATIVLNLQKDRFKRVDKAIYTLNS